MNNLLALLAISAGAPDPVLGADTAAAFDYKVLFGGAAAVAAAVTALVNVIRWFRERSRASRRAERVARAVALTTFVNSHQQIREAIDDSVVSDSIVTSARNELRVLLCELARPALPRSMFRKAMLLYPPRGWRGLVAHFLFYGTTAFVVIAAWGFLSGELESGIAAPALLVFSSLAILSRNWGALEDRLADGVVCCPKRIFGFGTWYVPNSRTGIAAQWLGAFAAVSLALICLPAGYIGGQPVTPFWQLVYVRFVVAASIPIACFWMGVEHAISEGLLSRPSLGDLPGLVRKFQTSEQAVGVAALCVQSLWLVVLVSDARLIPQFARSFWLDSGNSSLAGGISAYIYGVIQFGILPWFCVFRGLWALFGVTPSSDIQSSGNASYQ